MKYAFTLLSLACAVALSLSFPAASAAPSTAASAAATTATSAQTQATATSQEAIAYEPITYEPSELAQLAEQHVVELLDPLHDDQVEVNAGNLDPRMGPRLCYQPLNISLANNASLERQTTVMLTCDDRDNWRMFIPVRITQLRAIVVTARPLSAGQVIGRDDLKMSQIDIHQLRDSAYSDIDELIGAQVKRRVGANEPLQARHTCFVCRGQDVTIISGMGGLEIRATGVARSDGLLGDRVTVRNSRSNQDIQGVVSGSNEVRTQ